MDSEINLSESQDQYQQALSNQLRTFNSTLSYYAATLLGDERGWTLSFQSHFVGWPEGGGPPSSIELRQASLVDPALMVKIWNQLEQQWIVLKTFR